MLPKIHLKKRIFPCFLILILVQAQAQTLVPTEQPGPPAPQFVPVVSGSVDFADVDGDSAQDVIITGSNGYSMTNLYLNDGSGNFGIAADAPFIDIEGIARFVDIDGDLDQDVLLAGRNNQNEFVTRLYRNLGTGSFQVVSGSAIPDLMPVSMDFADIDGDGDVDLFISGTTNTGTSISSLYTNDGSGNFSAFTETRLGDLLFTGAFADIDGDNDPDLLLAGSGNTIIYINNGSGLFERVWNSLDVMAECEITFEDIDNDGDQDLLIVGRSLYRNGLFFDQLTSTIYINDGTGNFVKQESDPYYLEAPDDASIAFADIDSDGDKDILISGTLENDPFTGIYKNDGAGNFRQAESTIDYENGAFGLADVDLDGDPDLLITGKYGPAATLFINNGTGTFSRITGPFQDGLVKAKADFADFDGDGYQDLLSIGINAQGQPEVRMFLNEGNNRFGTNLSPFEIERNAKFVIGDLDNDGDPDVVVSGSPTQLYLNDATGNLIKTNSNLTSVNSHNIEIADMDNDNDQDIVLVGSSYPDQDINNATLKIFINDGSGVFTEANLSGISTIPTQNLEIDDVDGNFTKDIFVSGFQNFSLPWKAYFLLNDGDHNFQMVEEKVIAPVFQGTTMFEDIDGDGDPDLFVSGSTSGHDRDAVSNLYINDGNGAFQLISDSGIAPLLITTGLFADFDKDGDKDLFLSGQEENMNSGQRQLVSYLYLNDGTGRFIVDPNTTILSVSHGASAVADTDNDGDSDLFVSGYDEFYRVKSNLFQNVQEKTEDNPPIAVCKDIIVQLNSEGFLTIEPQDIDGGSADAEGDVVLSIDKNSFNCTDIGNNLVTLTVTDNNGQTASCTATVTIEKITPEIQLSVQPASQEYSDEITLSVLIPGGYCSSDFKAAEIVSFYIDSRKIGEAELKVSGRDLTSSQTIFLTEIEPGENQIAAVFEEIASTTYVIHDQETSLSIIPENAIVEYTGERIINLPDSEGTIRLSATVTDEIDESRGDIRNAKVKFVNRDSGAYLSGWLIPVSTDAVKPVSGSVAFEYPVKSDISTLTVGIIVEGYYYRNSTEDDVVIDISGPTRAIVTGGGKLVSKQVGGSLISSGNASIHFGLNANRKNENHLRGHLNLTIKHSAKNNGQNYQFKSNKIEFLSVGNQEESKNARIVYSGELESTEKKAKLFEQDVRVEVNLTDNGEPGTGDSIGFTVFDRNNNVIFSSSWNGTTTNELNLDAGNTVINIKADEEVVKGEREFDLQVFPNPTSYSFSTRIITKDKQSPVFINVYNLSGRLISQSSGSPQEEFSFGQNLSSGQYIIRLIQKEKSVEKVIVKGN